MTGRLLLLTTMAAAVLGLGYGAYEHFGERSRGTMPGAPPPAETPLVAAPEERAAPEAPAAVPELSEPEPPAPPKTALEPPSEAPPLREGQDAATAVLVPPDETEEAAPAADEAAPPEVAIAPPMADQAAPAAEAPAPPAADDELAAVPAPAFPAAGPRPEEAPARAPPPEPARDPVAGVMESAPTLDAPAPAAEAPVAAEIAPAPGDDPPAPPLIAERPDPAVPAVAPVEPVEERPDDALAAAPEVEAPPPAADPSADPVARGVEQIRRALATLLAREEDPAEEPEAAAEAAPPPPPSGQADPLPEEGVVAGDPAPAVEPEEPEVATAAAEPAAESEVPDLVSRSVESIRRALAAIIAREDAPPQPGAGPAPEAEAEIALAPADAEPRVAEEEVLPSFDIVRVAPDGRSVLAGRAAPGAEVEVRAGEQVIDAITADRRGQWIATPPDPLAPGHLELTLLARPPGGAPLLSSEVVVVVVPGPPPPQPPAVAASEPPPPQPPEVAVAEAEAAPEAVGGPPGEATAALAPADPLALLLPREGGRGRVLQAPGKISAGGELALMVLDYDESGQVRLTGEAPPGAPVRVYVDNQLAGEVVAGKGGDWSLVLARQLDPGDYTLRLDQLDPGGRPVARLETPFSRVGQPPVAGEAQVDYVIVQPGNSLWRISRRLFGQGMLYTQIYDANQGQIRDPDLIYPGQVFEVPRELGEAG
jgi:nucleoid-associated protein YgaU